MPTDPLIQLPGYALRRAAGAMMAELGDRLRPLGLKISDVAVLILLSDDGRRTSSEIGRILDVQRANMVPLLGRIERGGWIRREPIDRKSQALALTDAGRATLAQARTIIDCFESELMDRIPAEHRPHFLPALHALLGADS
jgi:DNA-binding MarR family transcriptional regulator